MNECKQSSGITSEQPQPIETSSLHEVNVWKIEQQKQNRLKRCQNLIIGSITEFRGGPEKTQKFFFPKCTAHSFDFGRRLIAHELEEAEYLVSSLHHNPITCPQKCTVYRPVWKAQAAKPFRWIWAQRKLIPAFGNWFIKLPALVQILIVIGIILAIAPQWKDPLIKIIKVIQGKE